jgi:hypothetical protein
MIIQISLTALLQIASLTLLIIAVISFLAWSNWKGELSVRSVARLCETESIFAAWRTNHPDDNAYESPLGASIFRAYVEACEEYYERHPYTIRESLESEMHWVRSLALPRPVESH